MANRYNGKIIVIDTTDTQIGGADATGGPKGPLSILAIKWVMTGAADIANTDKFNIEWMRTGGDIVIAADAQLAVLTSGAVIYSVEFSHPGWTVPGLFIQDLGGGELVFFLA